MWFPPEGNADSIAIPQDELRQVHETVAKELNLTSCPLTVSSVNPQVLYAYTKRVCELHQANAEAHKEGQPMAPSVNQVLRLAAKAPGGLTAP